MTNEAKKPEETKVTQLAPGRIQRAESANTVWQVTPESGTPADALLDPKYWAHYSVNPSIKLSMYDRFECVPEDGTYFLELLVTNIFRGGVKVKKLRLVEFDKSEALPSEDMGDHELKFSGPKLKWCIVRKSDSRRLTEGHADKQGALDWLREQQKSWAA